MANDDESKTMRAAVYHKYGGPDNVHVESWPRPDPKPDEVLIRIKASTVSSGDWRARTLSMPAGFGLFARPVFGLLSPRKPILGTELAGEVEKIGSAVTRFKVGDKVVAFPGIGMGCHAEFRVMSETGMIMPMPSSLSYEEAACLSFGGLTAVHFIRTLGKVKAGEQVLIIGASGAVGVAAVQIAKHLGAIVTAVVSTRNVEWVSQLNPDHVVDYKKNDISELTQRYDVVYDTIGGTPVASCRKVLLPGGRLLLSSANLYELLGTLMPGSGQPTFAAPTPEKPDDLKYLGELAASGKYKGFIDRSYLLEEISEAHAYVETGAKRGSVVVVIK